MENAKQLKKEIKNYFKNKYEDNEVPEWKTMDITELLLRIYRDSDKNAFYDDIHFINEFSREIDFIINNDHRDGKLIYTRTGYYKLNDGKKTSGYSGAVKADKYYINDVFDKLKINRLEYIINLYFENNFEIKNTNCLLSKEHGRWIHETNKCIRLDDDFIHLINTFL